jgi:protein-tyrosine phosphatase
MHKRLAVALLLSLSTIAQADVTRPACTQTGPTTYEISFSLTGDSHRVSISASTDPTGKTGRVPVLKTAHTQVTVTAGKRGQRMYFFLEPDQGRGREVSIRHIALEGNSNFRDIGGYETVDGRFVKWGLIYRTGILTYLTPADFAYLSQLDVRVVCDFRSHQEKEQDPEQWIPNSSASLIALPIGADNRKSSSASLQQFAQGHPSTEQLRQRMLKAYSTFALQFSPEFAKVFAELRQEHLPLVYHCTGGKDRTGVFTALLLRVLGVPQQTILDDYLLTNKFLILPDDKTPASQKQRAQMESMMKTFTPEQRQTLIDAAPEYLDAAFAAIEQRYGSFDDYRREALQLSDSDVSALRARLLTNE